VFAGMTAQINVVTASVDNVTRVPSTALQGSSTSGYYIQVVNAGGSVTTANVQVGLVTTAYAQVTSGLSVGQIVVTGTVTSRTSSTSGSSGVNVGSLTGNGFSGGRGVTP
jgi:multidrug efflux pump subunit AcrA (membrane-fusion protein)